VRNIRPGGRRESDCTGLRYRAPRSWLHADCRPRSHPGVALPGHPRDARVAPLEASGKTSMFFKPPGPNIPHVCPCRPDVGAPQRKGVINPILLRARLCDARAQSSIRATASKPSDCSVPAAAGRSSAEVKPTKHPIEVRRRTDRVTRTIRFEAGSARAGTRVKCSARGA